MMYENQINKAYRNYQAGCASQFQCPDFGCVRHVIMVDGEGDVILLDFIGFSIQLLSLHRNKLVRTIFCDHFHGIFVKQEVPS